MKKVTKTSFSPDAPSALFVNSFDTIEAFKSFQSFSESFQQTNKEQLFQYALSDLWLIDHLHYERHKSLRNALRFLLLAVIFMFISAGILLTGFVF
jgi:hypothetical protein